MQFHYDGTKPGGQLLEWFKKQLNAMGILWDAELPEAMLTIVYAGIDTFGLLAAPAEVCDANRSTFKQWCEEYILPRINTDEGNKITADDLYAARCGVLHSSTPLSKMEREGKACQLFYEFKGKIGVNMILNAQQKPAHIDIGKLAMAFKEGGLAFLINLKGDPAREQLAHSRAQHFLRWGTLAPLRVALQADKGALQ